MSARYAFDWYTQRGYAPHLAAGVVGNFMQESGPDLNPTAYNQAEDAFGIGQWRGDRLANLRRFSQERGLDPANLDTQLEFSIWEKQGPEAAAWQKVQGARDAAEAATLFDKYYERSAGLHTPQRIDFANSLLGQSPAMTMSGRNDPSGQAPLMQGPGALDQSNGVAPSEASGEPKTWWGKADQFMKNNSNDLLAIGSGLLSGTSWAEGIGAAGQNLLAVRQQEQENQQDMAELASTNAYRQGALANDAAQQNAPKDTRYLPVGTVAYEDGTQIGGVVQDERTGIHYTQGEDGTLQPIKPGFQAINRSDAYGTKGVFGIQNWNDETQALTLEMNKLEAFDRLDTYLQDVDYGINGLVTDLGRAYDTLMNNPLTAEALQRGATQAELQGIIGANRIDIVGPGTMTEPDALRIVTALGGDMQSILSNPELARERIGQIRQNALRSYEQRYNQLEAVDQKYPDMPYVMPPRYTNQTVRESRLPPVPGQDTGSAPSSEDITLDELLQRYAP